MHSVLRNETCYIILYSEIFYSRQVCQTQSGKQTYIMYFSFCYLFTQIQVIKWHRHDFNTIYNVIRFASELSIFHLSSAKLTSIISSFYPLTNSHILSCAWYIPLFVSYVLLHFFLYLCQFSDVVFYLILKKIDYLMRARDREYNNIATYVNAKLRRTTVDKWAPCCSTTNNRRYRRRSCTECK